MFAKLMGDVGFAFQEVKSIVFTTINKKEIEHIKAHYCKETDIIFNIHES